MQANTVKCTVCKRWTHKRYRGVRGDLSLVVDGFRCKRCDGQIQGANLAKDLVMDGETYRSVDEVPRDYAISDIQSSPARDERLSVCQLCQKQHDLWK